MEEGEEREERGQRDRKKRKEQRKKEKKEGREGDGQRRGRDTSNTLGILHWQHSCTSSRPTCIPSQMHT